MIPTRSTPVALIGVEVASGAEAAAVVISTAAVVIIIQAIVSLAMAQVLLPHKVIGSLQLRTTITQRRRRSNEEPTRSVSHQMVLITKRVTRKMILMKKLAWLLCLVLIPHSMFFFDLED